MRRFFKVWVVHTHERSEGSTIKSAHLLASDAEAAAFQVQEAEDRGRSGEDEQVDLVSVDEVWVETVDGT